MMINDETLSEIVFAMENQNESYVLCKSDMKIYTADEVQQLSVDEDSCVSLPQWTSANGYRLMTAFASSQVGDTKNRLLSALTEKGHTFRKFRDTVSELGLLAQWYSFKDERMAAYINRWYSDVFSIQSDDELDESTVLLLDYEIEFQNEIKEDVKSRLEQYYKDKPFEKYVAAYYSCVHAYAIHKGNVLCGVLFYADDTDGKVRVLYHYVEADEHREELEKLLWDHFNRRMQRAGISTVETDYCGVLKGIKTKNVSKKVIFCPNDWNSVEYETETTYLL